MIKLLDSSYTQRWDDFVYSHGQSTFFHLSHWQKVIEDAFGHKTYFFFVEEQNNILAILPLVHVKSLLFGNHLVSTSFCVYGGILSKNDVAKNVLIQKAESLAKELGVDFLELRNLEQQNPEWPHKDLYVTFRKSLDPDLEKNLQAIPRKQRAMVRKGIKAGLTSHIEDTVDNFYRVYSESVRNLGTPVFSKKYFEILKQAFRDKCEILSIQYKGEIIASVMNFYFKDEVLPYYGGGTEQARSVQGNDFMYWEVMRRAVERNLRIFDFGRSKVGTGSYRFKKHWGFEPQPLYYEFKLVQSKEMPEINPLNPKYQLFIKAWKKLPLKVSQFIGPWIAKDLG